MAHRDLMPYAEVVHTRQGRPLFALQNLSTYDVVQVIEALNVRRNLQELRLQESQTPPQVRLQLTFQAKQLDHLIIALRSASAHAV